MKGLRYIAGVAALAGLVGCTSIKDEGLQANVQRENAPAEWNCTTRKNFATAFGITTEKYNKMCERHSQGTNKLADMLVAQCGPNSERYDYACKLLEDKLNEENQAYRRWCLCDEQK